VVQKSTFKLTKHELDFISDPVWMSLKQKVIRNVAGAMHGLGEWLMSTYFASSPLHFKVTRGENYLDMPYVVLDAPQLKANDLAGKLRIMFWWGHYISLQYFVACDEQLSAKLSACADTDYMILTAGDLFNNQIDGECFIPVKQFTATDTGMSVTKICSKVPFTELENLQQHVEQFMKHIH
jgi:hypothetical protein